MVSAVLKRSGSALERARLSSSGFDWGEEIICQTVSENFGKSYIFDGDQSGLKLIVSDGGGGDCYRQPEQRLVISGMKIIWGVSTMIIFMIILSGVRRAPN